jgi:hypothetical protein
MLQKALKKAKNPCPVLRFSEHLSGVDGEAMFRHACALGLEGIVSKKLTSRYKSGACKSWVRVKNPAYERADNHARAAPRLTPLYEKGQYGPYRRRVSSSWARARPPHRLAAAALPVSQLFYPDGPPIPDPTSKPTRRIVALRGGEPAVQHLSVEKLRAPNIKYVENK